MSLTPTFEALLARLAEHRELYGKNNYARLVVQTIIPYVGPAIDLLLTEGPRRIGEERMAYFLAGLAHDVDRLGKDKVDIAYLASPDFEDLLYSAMVASVRAREREKVRFNARVLSGAIQLASRNQESGDDPHLFIGLLRDLDSDDIRVLRGFVATQHGVAYEPGQSHFDFAFEKTSKTLVGIVAPMRMDDMFFRIARLVGAGLVQELHSEAPDGPKHPAYLLQNVVHRLFRWLERFGGFPSDADIEAAGQPVP